MVIFANKTITLYSLSQEAAQDKHFKASGYNRPIFAKIAKRLEKKTSAGLSRVYEKPKKRAR